MGKISSNELNTELGTQISKIGTDVLGTTAQDLSGAVNEHLADYVQHIDDASAHGEVSNLYRSNKDANGVFATLEWKRLDLTLQKKSVLSGGTSPKYTTRTVNYYENDGIAVKLTKVFTLTYTDDDLTSEVTA